MQIEVDRRRVAPVAAEPHVPAAKLGVVLDGLDELLVGDDTLEVGRDEVVGGTFTRLEVAGVVTRHRLSSGRLAAPPQVQETSSRAPRSA